MGNPRPWYQLYLSTCLVLFLAAAGLLGLNLNVRRTLPGSQAANFSGAAEAWHRVWFEFEWYGWPFPMYGCARHRDKAIGRGEVSGTVFVQAESGAWQGLMLGWNAEMAILNVHAWLGIFLLAIGIMEWKHRGIPWRWLRLHGPTWVLVAISLSVLCWLNLREFDTGSYRTRGWPLRFWYEDYSNQGLPEARGLQAGWLALDISGGLLLLIMLAVVGEQFFRFRERKKHKPHA